MLVIILLTLSLTAVIIFFLIFFVERYWPGCSLTFLFYLMKTTMIFFLIPAVVFIFYWLYTGIGQVTILDVDRPYIGALVKYQQGWWGIFTMDHRANIGTIVKVLGWIWIIGVVVSFIRGIKSFIVSRKAFAYKELYSDNQKQEIGIAYIKEKLGKEKIPPIYVCDFFDTPVLLDIYKPKVVLNTENYSQEQFNLILLHEMIHRTRRDLFYKNIAGLLSVIYWFYPAIKWFVAEFYNYCELSCDEVVLKKISNKEKKIYIEMIGTMGTSFISDFSATALKSARKHIILRRVKFMVKGKGVNLGCMVAATAFLIVASPLAVLASSEGMIQVGKFLDRSLEEIYTAEEKPQKWVMEETLERVDIENLSCISEYVIQNRGTESIDVTIDGTEVVYAADINVKSGETVAVSIFGDSEEDKFKVSLVDEAGNARSVTSVNGDVTHKYQVTNSGKYAIVITGLTSRSIHIEGVISIK